MNRSISKIRHIQESNQRLEKRLLGEQFPMDLKKTKEDQYDDTDWRSDKFDFKKYQNKLIKSQIEDIINNFDSIDCENYNEMAGDFMDVPEYVSIYCNSYKGKTKDEMVQILNKI